MSRSRSSAAASAMSPACSTRSEAAMRSRQRRGRSGVPSRTCVSAINASSIRHTLAELPRYRHARSCSRPRLRVVRPSRAARGQRRSQIRGHRGARRCELTSDRSGLGQTLRQCHRRVCPPIQRPARRSEGHRTNRESACRLALFWVVIAVIILVAPLTVASPRCGPGSKHPLPGSSRRLP